MQTTSIDNDPNNGLLETRFQYLSAQERERQLRALYPQSSQPAVDVQKICQGVQQRIADAEVNRKYWRLTENGFEPIDK